MCKKIRITYRESGDCDVLWWGGLDKERREEEQWVKVIKGSKITKNLPLIIRHLVMHLRN